MRIDYTNQESRINNLKQIRINYEYHAYKLFFFLFTQNKTIYFPSYISISYYDSLYVKQKYYHFFKNDILYVHISQKKKFGP